MNNRWAILVLLFAVRLSFAYQFQSVGAVSPLLVEAWSIDYASLGILVSLYMFPGVVLALPGGMIGGRIGDRQMVIAGLGLMAVGGVVTGMAESYTVAVVGRLIAGVGGVLLNVLMTKMVMDWFAGPEIVTALAFYITSWPAGIAIALYTLAPFAEAVSLPAVFFLTAALNLVGLAALWTLYRQPPGALDGVGARAATSRLLPREVWLVVLVTIVWMSYSTLYLVLMSFAPSLLVERGLTAVDAAALTGVAAGLYAISTPIFGFVSERVNRPVPIVVASLLLMIAGFMGDALFPHRRLVIRRDWYYRGCTTGYSQSTAGGRVAARGARDRYGPPLHDPLFRLCRCATVRRVHRRHYRAGRGVNFLRLSARCGSLGLLFVEPRRGAAPAAAGGRWRVIYSAACASGPHAHQLAVVAPETAKPASL